MATQGSPGRMRIAKNTMLIAPRSIGTATMSRRAMYWTMAQSPRPGEVLVQDLEQLRVVVAVMQRELTVLGREGSAHPLGVARPLPGHVLDGQAHQVALDALLSLGVDRRSLLHVPLDPPRHKQIIDPLVVGEVG